MLLKKGWRIFTVLIVIVSSMLAISCGAARRPEQQRQEEPQRQEQQEQRAVEKPPLPEPIRTEGNQEPRLKVFIVQENRVEEMAFEDYVAGVVGGEIKNDWPEESIKAQAIIARTFVLQFIQEKGRSKYENAHVSTDIEEAQAWNMEAVNDRIRNAVNETRGQVIVHNGRFARTWFHSNAGGKTATAPEGLDYQEDNPPYIQVVDSPDVFPEVEEEAKNWSATFSKSQVLAALGEVGNPMQDFSNVAIGSQGPSGRTTTLRFDENEVSAPQLRLALGSTEMRSTLLDRIALEGNQVVMSGRGYGHGVGMSQWGAFGFANNGKNAEEIIHHYFRGIDVVKMWD